MAKGATQERPILFSGPMVRAILDGRKTQTRRVCKPQPNGFWDSATNAASHIYQPGYLPWWQIGGINHKCPYGKTGDHLWLREAWKTGCNLDKYSPKQIREKYEDAGYRLGDRANGKCCPMFYLAGGEHKRWGDCDIADFGEWGKTRVSIHMPRWASRITLEITDVRIEQLQDITEHDAKSEGVEMGFQFAGFAADRHPAKAVGYKPMFRRLWGEINGPDSWEANPWVWVVEFKRVTQ